MGLQGDLSTLDITNLFQNLEGARKTGLLTVRAEGDETQLFFADGKLALVAYPKRAALVDFLVASGAISTSALELAKKQKRRGQSLGAALVETGALTSEQLSAVATARLVDEACEVLAAGSTRFAFAEVERPGSEFDLDERALELALAASPLLLESARRSDHWTLIREHVPSDSAHFSVSKSPRVPADANKARFQAQVVKLLDGSRSVREVVSQFPTRRFDVYQLLADLARVQTIRPIVSADLNRQVLELARRDRKRALALLERGLEQNPHNLDLVCTKALLAEKMGELEQAAEALKLALHLQLEGDKRNEARATLTRLKKLDHDDPFAWERSFELALEESRDKDALADGRTLIEIYRKPGLHRKVVGVLERLCGLRAPTWELVRELAHARAAAGERDKAVQGLEKFAASLIGLESYPLACRVYEEVLALQPTRTKAKETLQDLKSGALMQRKLRWRKVRRRALAGIIAFVVVPWIAYEVFARRAFDETTRALVRERLLETGKFTEAHDRYAVVRARYAWSTVARFEIEPMLHELEERGSAKQE